jgi:hypothetical protein
MTYVRICIALCAVIVKSQIKTYFTDNGIYDSNHQNNGIIVIMSINGSYVNYE